MEPNLRILVVDDNVAIHNDFRKVLVKEKIFGENEFRSLEAELFQTDDRPPSHDTETPVYEVDSAYQGQEALEMVEKAEEAGQPYALIFMDIRMPPGWDGIHTISKIWERFPHIEMVICTAYSDYSWERITRELGTTDRLLFLRKPFDTTAVKQMALSLTQKWNLSRQAERYVKQLENEIRERRRSENQLAYLAHYDVLTGLANRTLFIKKLEEAIEKPDAGEKGISCFFIDLDRFKDINDSLGYPNGNRIIIQVAQRLRSVINPESVVARFAGDEFGVFVEGIGDREAAEKCATTIHQALEPLFEVEDLQLEVRASIGIVLFPEHGEDAETLLRRADLTMSKAKTIDPGFTFYDPLFDHFSVKRLSLLSELRAAINQDDLVLHYQPKVDMVHNKVSGFEALVRWRHPKHGMVSPTEFVPLAERSGLIKPLTFWVLREVCRHWPALSAFSKTLTVSINLSARDLLDSQLPAQMEKVLQAHNMDPKFLTVEITESAMMEDPDQARQVLQKLSDMGICLAIDDFGTGYSSLAYLKNLPVDEIKIDQSFVFDMWESQDDANIVKSTIDLGHTLGLHVIAEGVEREETWNMLRDLGCDQAQGYFVGVPVDYEKILEWMRSSSWAKALAHH
ncbi:MAG: EAL domain-containing protein [Acidobacteria bacterium]|nr:EAL domain-containing protein [Acidobacteriota bacterium]MCB9399477.1 EAL domain-containing protein [Acidobacteriota bacterium]